MKTLDDFRIRFSPFEESALAHYARWKNDPRNLMFDETGILRFFGQRELKAWFDNHRPGPALIMAVCMKDTDKVIGAVALNDIDHRNQTCCLGLIIGDRSAQGQGIGKEIGIMAAAYAFYELNMHKIVMTAFASNSACIRGLESIGGVREGVQKEQIFRNGLRMDFEYWALFKDGFNEKFRDIVPLFHSGEIFSKLFNFTKESVE